jgi:uncharacterized protein YjiS (DUF1127 family)
MTFSQSTTLATESQAAFSTLPISGAPASWQRRWRYRRHLQRLLRVAPHMIEDIGLTLKDARLEAEKPFGVTSRTPPLSLFSYFYHVESVKSPGSNASSRKGSRHVLRRITHDRRPGASL